MNNNHYIECTDEPLSFCLNKEIESGNINAICLLDNLFNYDPLLIENDGDTSKLSICRKPNLKLNHHHNNRNSIVLFVVVVIIAILALLAYKKMKK